MWWSGVFAMVAFVHLVRGLANVPVTIGTLAIPVWVSWVVAPVAGLVSGWLMRVALERKEPMPPPPSMIVPGGLHPKALSKEKPTYAAHAYCGIQAGYHPVGEDDEPEG